MKAKLTISLLQLILLVSSEQQRIHLEAEHKRMQLKADLLRQRMQLLKEVVSQEDINNLLPIKD